MSDEHIHEIIECVYRWAKIYDAIVVIDGLDDNERKDTSFEKFMLILTQCIELYRVITFAYGTREWYVNLQKITHSVYQTTLLNPDYTMQKKIWSEKIQTKGEYADAAGIEKIISMYSLTETQIEEAVEIVHRKRIVEKSGKISEQQLIMAARNVASRSLQLYGTRIQPVLSWNDIVLPQYTIEQLKELCRHARFANKVLNEWGFCNRSKYNSGLNVLLFGTPGTGKTMAAEVIANDLDLELYKVDLSMVVSKYIGETEKNLDAVFNEAQNLRAVLFFDEADALFGKRTEINDSHDRYANIEINYLLQRIEYHEGIVLLASNYKGNIDDAFTRRFRFFIELPFPDTKNRKEIWRKQFPPETPVEDDIQYDMLAEKYSLSGGSIKNACIRAAFLAASQNTPIGNDHLLYGIQQEYKKMGKPWIEPVNNNRVFRNMIDKSFVGAR
jgi:SpoVK/Ycf46/Vps4 family AAA+-type ATPase